MEPLLRYPIYNTTTKRETSKSVKHSKKQPNGEPLSFLKSVENGLNFIYDSNLRSMLHNILKKQKICWKKIRDLFYALQTDRC